MLHPLQVNFYSPEELFFFIENDDVTNRKPLTTHFPHLGSTIQERDKKNAEYYVGDYSHYTYSYK